MDGPPTYTPLLRRLFTNERSKEFQEVEQLYAWVKAHQDAFAETKELIGRRCYAHFRDLPEEADDAVIGALYDLISAERQIWDLPPPDFGRMSMTEFVEYRNLLLAKQYFFANQAEIIELLYEGVSSVLYEAVHQLPTHYLYAATKHLRRDPTHLQNRLTEFYHGDRNGPWLTRPPQQFATFEARYQHLVYDLAPRARLALAERGALPPFKRSDAFVHRLMTACVTASIELTAHALGLHYIALGEILAHPRCGEATTAPNPLAIPVDARAALVPDVLFGLHYPGIGYRFFAVEIDRNTESIERTNLGQSSFGRKVLGYRAILAARTYRSWWGLPNLHILTVTTNATHVRNLLDHIRHHVDPPHRERFAVTAEPMFGAHWRVPREVLAHLLEGVWQTPLGSTCFASTER